MNTTLDILAQPGTYTAGIEICPGCDNHCAVKTFDFGGGRTFHSGNQCERIYGGVKSVAAKGINMFAEKNRLLWNRPLKPQSPTLKIGIPRGLGIYEDFPFWCTLLTACGFEVVLSPFSSNHLYEKGIQSIMADNICFPAKLMHGHVMDLVERGVDRILYPWVVYEKKEDRASGNSYNCPIVSGYSDVLRSSIDPERRYGIPLDAPVVDFREPTLYRKTLANYLANMGVERRKAWRAIDEADAEQRRYLAELERRNRQVLQQAIVNGRTVIMLAGRPYHIDPLIEHRVSQAIADMGIDLVTENVASLLGGEVFGNINALSQWAYPNRIFKAAWFVANHPYAKLHMVELTSFGCGPDAFILDEVRALLDRFHKNLTVLKIDDVNNIGSLRLRIRSLVDSVNSRNQPPKQPSDQPFTTRPYVASDRRRVILAPYFAEGYSEYLPTLFGMAGYRFENLPMGSLADAEQGLREANNDICYPATIVVGSTMRALKSGRYNRDEVVVGITQTGGQCRASNYYSLIKDAMVRAGFADVPVVSVNMSATLANSQPGFSIPWLKIWRTALYAMLFADSMLKLYYPSVVREVQPGKARKLYEHYTAEVQPLLAARDYRAILRLLSNAATDFASITHTDRQVPRVGIVGEIYVKYNSFSNQDAATWLVSRGIEVVPPALAPFFLKYFASVKVEKQNIRQRMPLPSGVLDAADRLLRSVTDKFEAACAAFPLFRPFENIHDVMRLATQVVNPAANFGEGWYLPGEICHLAESGVDKVVSLQPFGCIANHIISKGIEKRIKELYPTLSLLFLDFDSGTSETNIRNRLHFMLANE